MYSGNVAALGNWPFVQLYNCNCIIVKSIKMEHIKMIGFVFLLLHYVFGLKYWNCNRKTRWLNTYKKCQTFYIIYHEMISLSWTYLLK